MKLNFFDDVPTGWELTHQGNSLTEYKSPFYGRVTVMGDLDENLPYLGVNGTGIVITSNRLEGQTDATVLSYLDSFIPQFKVLLKLWTEAYVRNDLVFHTKNIKLYRYDIPASQQIALYNMQFGIVNGGIIVKDKTFSVSLNNENQIRVSIHDNGWHWNTTVPAEDFDPEKILDEFENLWADVNAAVKRTAGNIWYYADQMCPSMHKREIRLKFEISRNAQQPVVKLSICGGYTFSGVYYKTVTRLCNSVEEIDSLDDFEFFCEYLQVK